MNLPVALIGFVLSLAAPAAAGDLTLVSPLDCDLATDCYIQQFMDHDPSPRVQDFQCADLSYDGHKGTDFALPSIARMDDGVAVLAAAAGRVRAARDDMPDTGLDGTPAEILDGRDCGNGLVIVHPGGWETQYCHMKRGSIAVSAGDTVAAGTPLGLVGFSGRTQFPHLHLSVRQDGVPVDPFDPDGMVTCDASENSTLWQADPPYRPGGLIDLGFADSVPTYAAIKAGTAQRGDLTTKAAALVIYAYGFGARSGDVLGLQILGPRGIVIEDDIELTRDQAQYFRAIGLKRPRGGWSEGDFTGTATLTRDGSVIETRDIHLTLR